MALYRMNPPIPNRLERFLALVFSLFLMARTLFADDILQDRVAFVADFPGGSLGAVERISAEEYRMEAPVQQDEKNLNRQRTWFAFRMDNLPTAKPVRVSFHTFDSCYNGRETFPRWVGSCPVFSADGKTWTNFSSDQSVWNDEDRTLTITITPQMRSAGGRSLYVAYTAMYVAADLARLEAEVESSPFVRKEIVGQSLENRPLTLFTISDFSVPLIQKKQFVILAREHAWEAHTSWQADAMVRFLASDSPEAAAIRQRAAFYVFPLVDIDGAENGQIRFNGNGYDVNRRWNEVDLNSEESKRLRPEVWFVKKKIVDLNRARKIDTFVNLHNDTHTDYIDAAGDPDRDWPRFRKLERLLLQTENYDPLEKKPICLIPTADSTVHSTFDLWWDNGIPGLMIEQKVCKNQKLNREPTVNDSCRRGVELVKILDACF